MIVEYLKSVIQENYLKSKEKGVRGKFILRNYPKEFYEKLIDKFENSEILFISDKDLNAKNYKKVSKEELAQFRNENVKEFNLDGIYYIVFITDEVIDTLNDLATLSVDDVKSKFLDLIENEKLREFFKLFLKEFEEADIFEIETFINEILKKYDEGYPLNEAIGDSLIYSFKCRKCVNLEKLKEFFKEYKKISGFFYKKKGNKEIDNDELIEAFNENKEDFESLEEDKLSLIKEFINADISDENYDRFRELDYKEDLVYKLFEKVNTPAKKLGEEIIDFLESKDILEEVDKEFLKEFDSLPLREKNKKRDFLKDIYEKHKILLEENRKLLKRVEKFIFPKIIEADNFFVALMKFVKETEADNIEISLNKKSKKAINEAYSKYALNYLRKRILPIKFDKIEFNIDLDFDFDNDKVGARYNDLVFIAKVYNKDEVSEGRFVFKYPVGSVLDGLSENIEKLKENLKAYKLAGYKTYKNKNFLDGVTLKNYISFEKEDAFGYIFVDDSDDIKKLFENIDSLGFVEDKEVFKIKIKEFLNSFKESLDKFEVKNLERNYIEILEYLHKYKEYDEFKRKIIKPFLNLATVKVDKNLIIIPAFHPLRIISFYYKIQRLNNVFNEILSGKELIKEDLFFEDLIYDFTSIHYPEIFKDEEILKVTEILDEYSLFEVVKKENLSKSEEVNIFLEVIKEYLNLNKHKQNIKIFIHSIKDLFSIELMNKLSKISNDVEIYFNDLDAKNIQYMYKTLLQKSNFKFNEVGFISNVKLNTLQNSFKALDEYNDKFSLSFLKDFISEKAEITKEERVYKEFIEAEKFNVLISKRKYLSNKEEKISKYLITPIMTKLSFLFYSLIDEKIPTLTISREKEFNNLEKIHNKSDWVVNLDEIADKKIIEDYGANVIKYKKNKFINKNLIISSKANTKLLENSLAKKLNELGINTDVGQIIKEANEISGDIVLRALKKGSFANELIGIVLSKRLFKGIVIYMDDYENYFKSNSTLSDLIVISLEIKDKFYLKIDLIESKFAQSNSNLIEKSFIQAKNAYKLFEKIFKGNYLDKENFKIKLADLIIENSKEINGFNTEEIRAKILFEDFDVSLNSYSLIFNYDEDDLFEEFEDEIKQIKFGKKQIKEILEGSFKLSKKEEKIEVRLEPVVQKEIIKLKQNNKTQNNEDEDIEKIKKSVIKIFRHHNLRANMIDIKFTPNAIRVSLKPELGWKENKLYATKDDFLTVEGLELLRVEALKGKYDLVFKRENREIVYYKDLIKNRTLSEGFSNTKILVGLDESNGEIVYYDLDSEDPHALIGGMTKSGKSVLLNLFIIDLITTNSPDELRLFLIDPKQVEFIRYKNIPHLEKIVTKQEEAVEVLKSLVDEMERRYSLFAKNGVNELKKYNQKALIKLPRIVVIFDEFADWMMDKEFKKEVENAIRSLAGKARAAGIHLIVSTQRPDNSVVVPILRANLGAKFALRVDSEKNSKIILDEEGAEKLLGYGHMIAKFAGEKHYVQGAFISDEEIDNILNKI